MKKEIIENNKLRDDKNLLKREDLTEHQKKIIRKNTQSILMFIGCFLAPGLVLLWARCYGTFFICLIINFIIPGIGWIISIILLLMYLPEWAFNNSTGYLRKLI